MGLITYLYRTIVPSATRSFIYELFLRNLLDSIRGGLNFNVKCKFWYVICNIFTISDEKYQTWAYMGKFGKTPYPGVDMLKYREKAVKIYNDEKKNMFYVVHSGKRLYFPMKSKDEIRQSYITLLIEQDEKCAHRYVKSHEIFNHKILVDIGAAEGIITLDAIEKIDFAYLFECDKNWIEALKATFEPWKNKVQIIEKYVGDSDDNGFITLDTFFKDKNINNLFLKMDIEGYETLALKGATHLFDTAKNLDFSICVYHKKNDEKDIGEFLKSHGYKYEISKNWLALGWWIRHGIIRSIQ